MTLSPTYEQYLTAYGNHWQYHSAKWQSLMCRIFLCRHFRGGGCIFARKSPLTYNEYDLRTNRLYENELIGNMSEKNIARYHETAKGLNLILYKTVFAHEKKKQEHKHMQRWEGTYIGSINDPITKYPPTDKKILDGTEKCLAETEGMDLGVFSDSNLVDQQVLEAPRKGPYVEKRCRLYRLYTDDTGRVDQGYLNTYAKEPSIEQIDRYGKGHYMLEKIALDASNGTTIVLSSKKFDLTEEETEEDPVTDNKTVMSYMLYRKSPVHISNPDHTNTSFLGRYYNKPPTRDEIKKDYGAGEYVIDQVETMRKSVSSFSTTTKSIKTTKLVIEEDPVQDAKSTGVATNTIYQIYSVVWDNNKIIKEYKGSFVDFPTNTKIRTSYGNGTYKIEKTEHSPSYAAPIILDVQTVYIQTNNTDDTDDTAIVNNPDSLATYLVYHKKGAPTTDIDYTKILKRYYKTFPTYKQIKTDLGAGVYVIDQWHHFPTGGTFYGRHTVVVEEDSASDTYGPDITVSKPTIAPQNKTGTSLKILPLDSEIPHCIGDIRIAPSSGIMYMATGINSTDWVPVADTKLGQPSPVPSEKKPLQKKPDPPKPVKPDQIYFLKESMKNPPEKEEDYDEIVL
jgi:hypothetical protein